MNQVALVTTKKTKSRMALFINSNYVAGWSSEVRNNEVSKAELIAIAERTCTALSVPLVEVAVEPYYDVLDWHEVGHKLVQRGVLRERRTNH